MLVTKAEWQSGYAADCNSVNIGSIPFSASKFDIFNKLLWQKK